MLRPIWNTVTSSPPRPAAIEGSTTVACWKPGAVVVSRATCRINSVRNGGAAGVPEATRTSAKAQQASATPTAERLRDGKPGVVGFSPPVFIATPGLSKPWEVQTCALRFGRRG
jgi:hypothetical protein